MKEIKRGTIEDRSTDRLLALAFEQQKQEKLLAEAKGDCGDCPGAQCADCPRWRESDHWLEDRELGITWPAPGTVEEAEFGPAVREVEVDQRDLTYGASRALTACIAALSASITAGLITTPEECVGVLVRVKLGFES